MLKTKGAAIFNTHERPIKICMHKTEGLKRQALKGMFSLMYITNSLLKNKRMLYVCKKISSLLQCNLDLVSLNLLTTCDLVTILQRPSFNLLHKIIRFSDIMQFSNSFCRDQKSH